MTERIPLSRLGVGDAAPGDRIVAFDAVTRITRAGFLARVQAWRTLFAAAPGADYALFVEDALEFAAALFGGWYAGKTLWLPGDTLPATLDQLRAQVDGFAGDLPQALSAPDPSPALEPLPTLDDAACQLMLFTSGSSGEPVAIAKCLGQLDAEVAALDAQFGAELGDAAVQGTVSHQHIYGLLFRVLWPLSAGRAFARQRLAYPEQIAALLDGAHALIASPAHLKRLPETLDWSNTRRSQRVLFSSGGPLSADAALLVSRLWGHAPIEVFGSTETGGIAWRRGGAAGSHWRALPGVHWRIREHRLEVRSPHLPDADWHPTQDRASAVPGNGFELLGRADRIVKLEERRISLGAIEQRLQDALGVQEARVVVLPGARTLLAIVAVLDASGGERLATDGKPALVQQLRQWLSGHVDPIALPRRWRFVDALPSDAQGKCSARALSALFRPLMPEPRWLLRETSQARLELEVDEDLVVFEGHFPTTAVVPGVALLDWAVRLSRLAFRIDGACLQMDTLKFQHVVRPGAHLTLDLDWCAERSRLEYRFRSPERLHASGRLHFSPLPAEPGTPT